MSTCFVGCRYMNHTQLMYRYRTAIGSIGLKEHCSLCAVNGSAQAGAYSVKQAINSNNGMNVNGQAMNFYWQRTPQARRLPSMFSVSVHMIYTTPPYSRLPTDDLCHAVLQGGYYCIYNRRSPGDLNYNGMRMP